MDQPGGVGRIERIGDLPDEGHRPGGSQPLPALQQRAQVDPIDEPHHEVEDVVLFAGVMDIDHVRVMQARGQACLALEALAEFGVVRQLRGDDLHGDPAPECQMGGLVDHAHAALRYEPVKTASAENVAGAWSVRRGHDGTGDDRRPRLLGGQVPPDAHHGGRPRRLFA
ncbi:unannotated protein [freshwater metagenome]|uniref:Unannotated protein n=1 Tax=freshwater metagenome TaxID=449393 RepID=A0A6J7DI74_9ZZZZ